MIDTSALSTVCKTVQHNCAVSDARFARDYSLCIYLLRMREFYRWENRIRPGASIDPEALGAWVSDTEMHWDTIEETEFLPLQLNGSEIEPFDADAVNEALADTGVVYSAGIGRLGQPHFVLAKLHRTTLHDGTVCIECGDELARDTIIMPAMAQGSTVFIRHQSFAQLLWQMLEEWRLKQPSGPMARVVKHFGIHFNDQLDQQIALLAETLGPLLLQHELGERAASELLGADFSVMTQAFLGRRGEMQIRAVRDLLADCLRTWPFIVQEPSPQNTRQLPQSIPQTTPQTTTQAETAVFLDFWLAGLNGYREVLLKQSPLAQPLLTNTESLTPKQRVHELANLIEPEQQRWQNVAMTLVDDFKKRGNKLDVEATIQNCASTWT